MSKVCPSCGAVYDGQFIFCPVDQMTLRSLESGDELVGSVIADRYLITRKLGEGGMGCVYLARHVRLPQQVAIKVLHPTLLSSADSLTRFNHEASNQSRISNEHVVKVYDFGETGSGQVYIAMEYVEGEPLTELLAREGALPPARAVSIARQVADALASAHDLGIVHRDLKPDNIMVTKHRDGSDIVKVVDFGIAKAMQGDSQQVTRTGLVIGTPAYMSPEQFAAIPLDGRSDIYSLGLVTFRMLTGRLPFGSATPGEEQTLEWALKRLSAAPTQLAQVMPDAEWPAELQAAIDRALARNPDERYASVLEFARDLVGALVQREGITARGTEPWSTHALGGNVSASVAATSDSEFGGEGNSDPHSAAAHDVAAAAAGVGRGRTFPPRVMIGGGVVAAALVVLGIVLASRGTGRAGAERTSASDTVVTAKQNPPTPGGNSAGLTNTATTFAGDSAGARSSVQSGAQHSSPADDRGTRTPPTQPPVAVASNPENSGHGTRIGGASSSTSAAAARLAQAQAELDRVKGMLEDPTAVGVATAREALRAIAAILPVLPTRADSVEAQYYAVEANLHLDRPAEACKVLRSIGSRASGTRFAARVERLLESEELGCR